MKVFVTGAAGFIGSNLADRLLAEGHDVVGFDNFSTGLQKFLQPALEHPRFRLVRGDVLNATVLGEAMKGCDFVFHLAANADIRFGTDDPRRDLDQNTTATFNVLEAMRMNKVPRIAFSSTGVPFLRVEPKAASFACLNLRFFACAKNSMSLGLEPGQPPSM